MNKTFHLGHVFGLKLMAKGHAFFSFLLVWLVLSGIGIGLLDFRVPTAVIAAFVATLTHWISETWHHMSHAIVARRVGWPMSGIMYVYVLATSLYPRDEPELSADIHIKRALGGPIGSLILTAVALALFLITPRTSPGWYIWLFALLDNLLVFSLGAFLPLGFTDGSTILHYRKIKN